MREVHRPEAEITADPGIDDPSMTEQLRCAVQNGSVRPRGPRLDARTQPRFGPIPSAYNSHMVAIPAMLLSPKSRHASRTPPSRLSRLFGSGLFSPKSHHAFRAPPSITVGSSSSRSASAPSRATHRCHLPSLLPQLPLPLNSAPGRSAHHQPPPSIAASRCRDVCASVSGSAPGRSAHHSHLPRLDRRPPRAPQYPTRLVTRTAPTHPDVSPSERDGT